MLTDDARFFASVRELYAKAGTEGCMIGRHLVVRLCDAITARDAEIESLKSDIEAALQDIGRLDAEREALRAQLRKDAPPC